MTYHIKASSKSPLLRTPSQQDLKHSYNELEIVLYEKAAPKEGVRERPSKLSYSGVPGADWWWRCVESQMWLAAKEKTAMWTLARSLRPSGHRFMTAM